MSDQDETKHNNIRESWIESLLLSATKPQDNSERLPRAMRQIDGDGAKNEPTSNEAIDLFYAATKALRAVGALASRLFR